MCSTAQHRIAQLTTCGIEFEGHVSLNGAAHTINISSCPAVSISPINLNNTKPSSFTKVGTETSCGWSWEMQTHEGL